MNDQITRTNGYLARQEIERLRSTLTPRRLEHFGYKVYSQGDEDGIIEEIFYRLGIYNGTFVEIGVEEGLECNTHYLLHKGWVGHWFEGNPLQATKISDRFHTLIKQDKLRVTIAQLTKCNINSLFTSSGLSKEIDFSSQHNSIFCELDLILFSNKFNKN